MNTSIFSLAYTCVFTRKFFLNISQFQYEWFMNILWKFRCKYEKMITTPSERTSTNFEFTADLLHSHSISAYVKKIIEISNLVGRGEVSIPLQFRFSKKTTKVWSQQKINWENLSNLYGLLRIPYARQLYIFHLIFYCGSYSREVNITDSLCTKKR